IARQTFYAQQPRFPRRVLSQFGTGNRPPRRSRPHHLDRGPFLLPAGRCGLILLAQALAAGVFAPARPPGAVARRRPLVAGLRNTRGSRVSGPHVAVHASGGHHHPGFDRRHPAAARHTGRVRLLYYIMGRVLPVWAVVYSLSVWWMIWSPTEEMTYQAYALPRIQALSGRTWVAMVVVGFWWALQHSLLPFLPDWRSALWRRLSRHPVSRLRALHRAAKLAPSRRERHYVPLLGPRRSGGNLDDWSRGLLLAAHVGRNLAANQPGGQYALDGLL